MYRSEEKSRFVDRDLGRIEQFALKRNMDRGGVQ